MKNLNQPSTKNNYHLTILRTWEKNEITRTWRHEGWKIRLQIVSLLSPNELTRDQKRNFFQRPREETALGNQLLPLSPTSQEGTTQGVISSQTLQLQYAEYAPTQQTSLCTDGVPSHSQSTISHTNFLLLYLSSWMKNI